MNPDLAELDHDTWQYAPPKLRSAGKINFKEVPGVLPFSGVRNPITTSSVSHKVALTYRTAANNWQPKIGAAESMAEAAVAMEALVSPHVFDVEFQPLSFSYVHPSGQQKTHTIDLRITFKNGLKRFVFVRNASSLEKPAVQNEIDSIADAVPGCEAHEFMVVDGDAYSRPRRDNLRRMHHLIHFQTDPKSDGIVAQTMFGLRDVWHLSTLFKHVQLPKWRVFQSVLRLAARGILDADYDAVICEHSRVWVASDD